ncbi:MAG: GNAT family N-acetyltransferase [Desulfovibrionaceae bacterium]
MNATQARQRNMERLKALYSPIEPGQKATVGPFRPEDAQGVSLLYYAIYGDKFPLDYVYDPKLVTEANAGPDLYQYVARTERGDIVGVSALFRVAPFQGIMETGGLMVLPDYRTGTLAFRLNKATSDTLPRELNLHAVYGQSVCDHTAVQKMIRLQKCEVFGLEMEAMPARPERNEGWAPGRISLLNAMLILRDVPHVVHLPEAYADFLLGRYAATGLQREIGPAALLEGTTRSSVKDSKEADLVKLIVEEPGADMAGVLDAFESEFSGRHIRQVHLPLACPGLDQAVNLARERGFFLGGVLPLWTGSDVFFLQKLRTAPDFDRPRLLSDDSKALRDRIAADWKQTAS